MSEKAPGFEKYTPTRLDWLAVQLNSILPIRLQGTGLEPLFSAGVDGKTLLMLVENRSNLDQERLDNLVKNIESIVITIAESYEWNSWLEFEVHFVGEENDKQPKNDSLDK